MKKDVLKSFSCFGCDCVLECVSFEHSRQEVFQVSVRYSVCPKDWNSNYQVITFGEDESAAMRCFAKFIQEYICSL